MHTEDVITDTRDGLVTARRAAADLRALRERIWAAGQELDTHRVADLMARGANRYGVLPTWHEVCLPLLVGLPGHSGTEIAVEHTLSEGIRIGLDLAGRHTGSARASRRVVLAAAEQEGHCLGLHALAAALRERGHGCVHLGAALPWSAWADVVRRIRPRTVVVWAQTGTTGRPDRLARLAQRFPSARWLAAGPGWPVSLPEPLGVLPSLTAALHACLSADRTV